MRKKIQYQEDTKKELIEFINLAMFLLISFVKI